MHTNVDIHILIGKTVTLQNKTNQQHAIKLTLTFGGISLEGSNLVNDIDKKSLYISNNVKIFKSHRAKQYQIDQLILK